MSILCRCYTSFQLGATGTDKNDAVLTSGTQLQKIGSLSILNTYADARNAIAGVVRICFAPDFPVSEQNGRLCHELDC
jgi:hypothetical protein